jgi:hypothetical protein
MNSYNFEISDDELTELLNRYPNMGKNSHVGGMAVELVKKYFLAKHPEAIVELGKAGADLQISHAGGSESFEIKGTPDENISWTKLKVSSQDCYNALIKGMILIRVCNVGNRAITLHFMKYNEDFTLVPEVRFAVKRIKPTTM